MEERLGEAHCQRWRLRVEKQMDQEIVLFLISEMLSTSAKIAAPVLFTSLAVGLVVSVIQVVTQIQEATLTFVPKMIAAVFVILFAGGWMLNTLVEFTKQIFQFAASA